MKWDDAVLLVINIVGAAIPLSISIWADAFYQDQPEIPTGSQVRMNIVYIKPTPCKIPFDIVKIYTRPKLQMSSSRYEIDKQAKKCDK